MNKRSVFSYALLSVAACAVAAHAAALPTNYSPASAPTAKTMGSHAYSQDIRAGSLKETPAGLCEITNGGLLFTAEHTIAPGGANEVRGTKGKIGDWFFDGHWRFRVNSVSYPDFYQFKYAPAGSDKPSGANDELVVFNCTLKNGTSAADQPILSSAGLSTQATALTDDQDNSYPPIDFDARNGQVNPGSAKSFAVIFSVPKGTNLTQFIFTIYSYSYSTHVTNIRIILH